MLDGLRDGLVGLRDVLLVLAATELTGALEVAEVGAVVVGALEVGAVEVGAVEVVLLAADPVPLLVHPVTDTAITAAATAAVPIARMEKIVTSPPPYR